LQKRDLEWLKHLDFKLNLHSLKAEKAIVAQRKVRAASAIPVKPKKKIPKGTKRYELHKLAKATLGIAANLRTAVKLPPGEDLNEWLASHTIDFYNQCNLLYGSIMEFCDEESCPLMTAGPNYKYLWADENNKKPVECPARTYIDNLFTWIQGKLDDEEVFPTTMDKPFPKTFKQEVQVILKRLFRVFAHIYVHHFLRIQELGEEAHLNAAFKHFLFFTEEFDLVDKKELMPLAELIERFTGRRL